MTAPQDVRRLKYAVEACVNGVWGDEPDGEDDMVVVRVADFDRAKGVATLGDSPTVRGIPESARNRRVLRPGDLLIEKSGGGEQQPVGNVVLFTDDRPAVCSNFVARMPVVADCDSRFVGYVFRALYAEGRNFPHIKQTSGIQNLDSESYLNETAWLPARGQQEHIANFLDVQTARIDALIAEKDCLQERLSEYRRSLVSNAVTQGVPGRHTDLLRHDFLGFVPKGWGVGKFRHYVQVRSGQVNPEDQAYANLVLVAPNHIESGTGRLLSTESAVEQSAESGKYWCDAGDVIYSKIRPALRKATVAPFDCLCSADMYPLKGLGPLSNQYLFWYLLSEPFSDFAVQESMRVAMPKLNRETLADAVIPLPSPNEQTEIVAYVKRATAAVDDVASHVAEHIARLREYRSSLISAAVTGQLDLSTFKAAE